MLCTWPHAQSTVTDASKALNASGVDVAGTASAVTKTASTAANAATPFVTKFFQFLASTDPVTLGEYALGLVALSYLTPALLGGLSGGFRCGGDEDCVRGLLGQGGGAICLGAVHHAAGAGIAIMLVGTVCRTIR